VKKPITAVRKPHGGSGEILDESDEFHGRPDASYGKVSRQVDALNKTVIS
jgi:hypothetical protein